MSVKEAAKVLGVSVSTIYRRIRKGTLQAHKKGRRWVIVLHKESESMEWHSQIHRESAEKDGLKPEDFTWLNYSCSNLSVKLLPQSESKRMRSPLAYLCDVPPDTPQLNQYFKADQRKPDKEYKEAQFRDETWWELLVHGTALSLIAFEMREADTGLVLDRDLRGHVDGKVTGQLSESAELWNVLENGGSPIDVTFHVQGLFFPYCTPDKGDGGMYLTTNSNGYLYTPWVDSGVHTLALDENSVLILDGVKQPPPPKYEESEEEKHIREESDRMMREEREAHEKRERAIYEEANQQNKEHNERMERENASMKKNKRKYVMKPKQE